MIGTDTGVGKTVFSGLFARYLMDAGVGVRAVKPFCSGGMEDVEFLTAAQGGAWPSGGELLVLGGADFAGGCGVEAWPSG